MNTSHQTLQNAPRSLTERAPEQEARFVRDFVHAATSAPFFRDLLRSASLRRMPLRTAA